MTQWRKIPVLLGVILLCANAKVSGQFSDDFDDGMANSRWTAPIWSLEDPKLGPDGAVNYAFDYSVVTGPAPRTVGGTTIGVSMATNLTDAGPVDEGESVGIVPVPGMGVIPAGDFKFSTDAYLFWNGQSGSTEYMTIGVHNMGTAVPLRFGLNPGDGLAWQVDTDGDSGTDILRYENPGDGETGLGGWEDIPFGAICGDGPDGGEGFNTGEPGIDFPGNQFAGPANRWINLGIESVGGMVSLTVNNLIIDTFDNTGGAFTGGQLVIGQSDPFNSVNIANDDGLTNMVIFDNVSLTTDAFTPSEPLTDSRCVPEPATLVVFLLGLLGTSRLWRK